MARKKQPKRENTPKMQGFIAGAGEIQAQDINDTLRQNYKIGRAACRERV